MKILKSLIIIVAVAALASGATSAYFTSRAEWDNNTITAGTLEIRINGENTAAGFVIPNLVPDKGYDKYFQVMNYGLPGFAGPSTLPAKELAVTALKTDGSQELYDALWVQLYVNKPGWTSANCVNPLDWDPLGKGCSVYQGRLSGLDGSMSTDILDATVLTEFAVGETFNMDLDVLLAPADADPSLMGQTLMFDLYVDGYNPHRI
jgi:predicted ribosomally synthesized peptide with SipW-like signal peptide